MAFMQTAFLVLFLVITVAASEAEIEHWRKTFHRGAKMTEAVRLNVAKSMAQVQQLRAKASHATYHLGPFAAEDWTLKRSGLKVSATALATYTYSNADIAAALNTSKDWQGTPLNAAAGEVTRIKNQGNCGSCWAFANVATIETMAMTAGGPLRALSEQYILNCLPPTGGLNGCGSGDTRALAQLLATKLYAIPLEKDYEYMSYNGTDSQACKTSAQGVVTVSAAYVIGAQAGQQLEDAMAAWVLNRGPIVVAVKSALPEWQFYESGVCDCPSVSNVQDLDHAVTIVGYGTTRSGIKYWKVKNSWTPRWGENGYIRLKRGTNACGISLYNVVTVV